MNNVSKIILFLFLSSLYYLPLAGNNYYWLLKIKPNLRTFIAGLGRTSLAENGSTLKPEMHFYHLNKDYLETQTSKGPNPQMNNGWSISKLMDLNWQNLPKTKISTLDNHPSYFHFSPASASQENLLDIASSISSISQGRNVFFRSESFLNNASDYLNTPWNNLHFALQQYNFPVPRLIEIKSADFPLVNELKPIPPLKLAPQQDSLLMATINDVLLEHDSDDSAFDPNVANLLSALGQKNSTQKENLFFCPALKSYLQVSEKTQSALTLVPHETMIELGLIPGASYENETHMNPDNWGYDK